MYLSLQQTKVSDKLAGWHKCLLLKRGPYISIRHQQNVIQNAYSRNLYNALYQRPPTDNPPPNWIRSRIRRRHLVSLGIPVNLDEVLPNVNGKNMPALQLTTRPMSAPPSARGSALNRVASPTPGSASNSRPGTPKLGGSPLNRTPIPSQPGLGPKPDIDEGKISQALSLTPGTFLVLLSAISIYEYVIFQDALTLLPLPTLQKQLTTIRSLTADTSSLLTFLLQQRDSLNQDAETYNGLIAELVGEAQKMKSGVKGKTRTGSLRRTSGMK